MAALAFPAAAEDEARAAAEEAWAASFLLHNADLDPDPVAPLLVARPQYAALNHDLIWKRVRTGTRRLRDRMVAARIVRPFLHEACTGEPPELPLGVARLSLNELCKYVMSESGESFAENVEKRIWRPSVPVIHLASAFDQVGLAQSGPHQHFRFDFQDVEQHERVVALALIHEEWVLADRRLGVRPEKLLRVRWER